MPNYNIILAVYYKQGILDPQAKAIQEAIVREGYTLDDLVWGKYCSYVCHAKNKQGAAEEAREICEAILSNPVIETYEILSVKKITSNPQK